MKRPNIIFILWDDYAGRPAAAAARMRIDRDLLARDVKGIPPQGISDRQRKLWYYDRYIKDYLRCVAGIDRNVGRLLDHLDSRGLAEDTIVVYSSDQGFFLGDHGWYDKRFIYEESLNMPLLVRYPREIPAGSTTDAMMTNVDFAPTLLDLAGVDIPETMQGRSARSVMTGQPPDDWQQSVYYRYWMHCDRTCEALLGTFRTAKRSERVEQYLRTAGHGTDHRRTQSGTRPPAKAVQRQTVTLIIHALAAEAVLQSKVRRL